MLQYFQMKSEKIHEFLMKYWGLSGAEACKSCRSRQELSNEYFLAKFGVDTEENEPYKSLLIWLKNQRMVRYRTFQLRSAASWTVRVPEPWKSDERGSRITTREPPCRSACNVRWAAKKRFEISKFKFKFPRARTYEMIGLVLGCIEAKFCK